MNIKSFAFVLIIFSFVGFTRAQNLERGETLKGRVSDKTGGAISNVKIAARNLDNLTLHTTTDEDGFYEIYLPTGNYNLEFVAPKGFSNQTFINYKIRANSKSARKLNVILQVNSANAIVSEFQCMPKKDSNEFECDYISRLERSENLILSGYILDLNRETLKNVAVKAYGDNNQNFLTKSDKNGFFYLILPMGKYNIEFWKKGFRKLIYQNLSVNLSNSGKQNININLEKSSKAIRIAH